LALKVCTLLDGIVDISELDFTCLVDEGQTPPDTYNLLLQLIITKLCYIQDNYCEECNSGSTPTEETPIPLPECLWYYVGEEQITELLPTEYAELLASTICDILSYITSLEAYYADINARLTILEIQVAAINCECTIEVTSGCLSYITTPGETVAIATAFETLESNLCNYIAWIGTIVEIDTAIGVQCSGLKDEPQLADLAHTMSELSGWIDVPDTIADSIQNLWLTICDLRAKVMDCCDADELCVPMPPTNVQITDVSETGCTLTWDAPVTTSTEDPIEYNIEIWEWDGIAVVGLVAIISDTTTELTYDVTGIPDPDKYYVAYVTAVYENCGESANSSAYGYMQIPIYTQCITITEGFITEEGTCDGSSYNYKVYTVTATLRNYATQAIITNPSTAITIGINLTVVEDCTDTTTTEEIFVVIPTGMSSGSNTYNTETQEYCDGEASCQEIRKTLDCVSSISNTSTTICPDSAIEECLS
jgi:hypothetical protein